MSQDLQDITIRDIDFIMKTLDEEKKETLRLYHQNMLLWRWVVLLAVVILLLIGALTDWKMPFVGGM